MDLIGLSYEAMQLEDPTFFSPKNTSLITQFKAIAHVVFSVSARKSSNSLVHRTRST